VQFGRDFGKDFPVCLVRLEAARLRMIRWGVSMGIDVQPLDPQVQSQLAAYPPEEIETALDLLDQIQKTFQGAQSSSESFKKIKIRKGKSEEATALDTESELDKVDRRFKILHQSTHKIAQQYQKAVAF
jgi:hypothetical protein